MAAGAQPPATLRPHLAAVLGVREAYADAPGVRPASVLHAMRAVEQAVVVAQRVDDRGRAPGTHSPWFLAAWAASEAVDARATAASVDAVPQPRREQTAWEMRQADAARDAAAEAEGRAQVALLAAEFLPLPAVLLALPRGPA